MRQVIGQQHLLRVVYNLTSEKHAEKEGNREYRNSFITPNIIKTFVLIINLPVAVYLTFLLFLIFFSIFFCKQNRPGEPTANIQK